MDNYVPPFTFTSMMIDYTSSITEKIVKLDNYTSFEKKPLLRRNNRIKSIQSSLAIEANSLSLKEVSDVIDGKLVLGPQKEIQEVKNAYKAYEMIEKVNPYSPEDLKKIHAIMTYLILEESGEYRKGSEGVFDGEKCIHVCPPPEKVEPLINALFMWMQKNKNKLHPLILSAIFHYEFVFIHPFKDGKGRTARLWHNIILYNWNKLFAYLPLESQIKKYQDAYYKAIDESNKNGESTIFIEFMLKMIDEVLDDALNTSSKPPNETNININKLLNVLEKNEPVTSTEIMERLGIKSKETLRSNYLDPAIEEGLVALTIPDKPTSKNQMYYKKQEVYASKQNGTKI